MEPISDTFSQSQVVLEDVRQGLENWPLQEQFTWKLKHCIHLETIQTNSPVSSEKLPIFRIPH